MDVLVLRVAARHQAAAMSEDKLKALLLKIRKGTTASLNWSQLGQVLAVLDPGWKVEKITGLVKLYEDEEPEEVFARDRSEVEPVHKRYSADAVNSLPAKPKHGKMYILDLTQIEEKTDHAGRPKAVFLMKPWIGHEGWKVTTPQGEVFNGLPTRFQVRGSAWHGWQATNAGKQPLYDVIPWLNKNTNWLDQINKKLDMDPHEKAVPRTRENTGSCPVCFQNIKLSDDKIVLHGYKRPGHGTTVGNCDGVRYPPFELSVEGTKDYLEKIIEPRYENLKKNLQAAKSGKIQKLDISWTGTSKWITPEDPNWQYNLDNAIKRIEKQLEAVEVDLKAYTKLVQNWKKRELPKEGEKHIDWFFQGQKG